MDGKEYSVPKDKLRLYRIGPVVRFYEDGESYYETIPVQELWLESAQAARRKALEVAWELFEKRPVDRVCVSYAEDGYSSWAACVWSPRVVKKTYDKESGLVKITVDPKKFGLGFNDVEESFFVEKTGDPLLTIFAFIEEGYSDEEIAGLLRGLEPKDVRRVRDFITALL